MELLRYPRGAGVSRKSDTTYALVQYNAHIVLSDADDYICRYCADVFDNDLGYR